MVQLTKDEIIKITMRLQSVRQGLVQKAPFYAILLFGLRFSLDDMVERVYTDGERIAFNPDFLKEITDKELEFIMLHEVSHVALGHPFRCVKDFDIEIFDEACDIVVNSNIYHYMGDDESFITIKGLGTMPHKNYNNEEGYNFTVEQVYEHLFKIKGKKKKDENGTTPDFSDIFDEEDFDEEETEEFNEPELDDENVEDEEEVEEVDVKGSSLSKNKKKAKKTKKKTNNSLDGGEESEEINGEEELFSEMNEDDEGDDECDEQGTNSKSKDAENSKNKKSKKENSKSQMSEENSDSEESDDESDCGGFQGDSQGGKGALGKGKPKKNGVGKSACELDGNPTSLSQGCVQVTKSQFGKTTKGNGKTVGKGYGKALEKLKSSQIKESNMRPVLRFDDHSFWKGEDEHKTSRVIWENRVLQTYETVQNLKRISIGKRGTSWGSSPCFAERIFQEIAERKLDWKTLLNDFVQENVCDYSFSPPDRRFDDGDFFLPDFNEKEESVENLLFMIDTSGSMSDGAISEVYSEIKGAIEQFNGRIKGWLGFFDAIVTEPQPFEDEDEFKAIRIKGGGGTAFLPIFHYVRDHMKDKNITSIIILTDGYAPFPEEHERMGIPVLWIINNENATPPWGMIARIPEKNN